MPLSIEHREDNHRRLGAGYPPAFDRMRTFPAKRSSALWVLALLALAWPVWGEEGLLTVRAKGFDETSSIGSALRVSAPDRLIDARISDMGLAQVLRALEGEDRAA